MKVVSAVCIAIAIAIAVPVWAADLPPACTDPALLADVEMRDTCEQLARYEQIVPAYDTAIAEMRRAQARVEASTAIATARDLFNEAVRLAPLDDFMARHSLARAEAIIEIASQAIGRMNQDSATQ